MNNYNSVSSKASGLPDSSSTSNPVPEGASSQKRKRSGEVKEPLSPESLGVSLHSAQQSSDEGGTPAKRMIKKRRCAQQPDGVSEQKADEVPELPDELWLTIFSLLGPKDGANVQRTCQQFNRIDRDPFALESQLKRALNSQIRHDPEIGQFIINKAVQKIYSHPLFGVKSRILKALADNFLKKGEFEKVNEILELPDLSPMNKRQILVELIQESIRRNPEGDYQSLIDKALNLEKNPRKNFDFLAATTEMQMATNVAQGKITLAKSEGYDTSSNDTNRRIALTANVDFKEAWDLMIKTPFEYLLPQKEAIMHCFKAFIRKDPSQGVVKAKECYEFLRINAERSSQGSVDKWPLRWCAEFLGDALFEVGMIQMEMGIGTARETLLAAYQKLDIAYQNLDIDSPKKLEVIALLAKIDPRQATAMAKKLVADPKIDKKKLFGLLAQLDRGFALDQANKLLKGRRTIAQKTLAAEIFYTFALNTVNDREFTLNLLGAARKAAMNIVKPEIKWKLLKKIAKLNNQLKGNTEISKLEVNFMDNLDIAKQWLMSARVDRHRAECLLRDNPDNQEAPNLLSEATDKLKNALARTSNLETSNKIIKEMYLIDRNEGVRLVHVLASPEYKNAALYELVKLCANTHPEEAIRLALMIKDSELSRGLAFAEIAGSPLIDTTCATLKESEMK